MDEKQEAEPKKKTRICLKCEKPFDSEGNFNRICKSCKKSNNKFVVLNEHKATELI